MPDTCFAYVLGSMKDGAGFTYVGWTNDLEKRLKAHNSGKGAKSTRGRQWEILHTEEFKNRADAMSREWYLKRDRKFRKQLLEDFMKRET